MLFLELLGFWGVIWGLFRGLESNLDRRRTQLLEEHQRQMDELNKVLDDFNTHR